MSCRTGPLRAGRSLRDARSLRVVAQKIVPTNGRGDAKLLHTTKWSLPAQSAFIS